VNIPSSNPGAAAVPAPTGPALSVAQREVRLTSLLIVAAVLLGLVVQVWLPPGGVTLVAGAGLASLVVVALSFVVPGRLRETLAGFRFIATLLFVLAVFAMVGTLIGLISMLSKMESPDEIGRGMAVALVCTFYGALLANLVFLPLGGKLGQHSKAEKMSMEMISEGICAIAKGDSPTAVREKMQVFISAKRREAVKAKV
jgi:chemotaxis protein MotA